MEFISAKKIKLAVAIALFGLCSSAQAQEITRSQNTIDIYVSTSTGHIIDWSDSGQRIERVFIDNPEEFQRSFVFATDGCTKDKCSQSATMINISARGLISNIKRGSIKVVLVDRRNRKSAIAVRVVAVPWATVDPITKVRK